MPNREAETQESLARALRARVRELDCLFGISKIVERSEGSLDQILAETVEVIPLSSEHPEVACARITLGGQEFRSSNFAEAPWRLEAECFSHGKKVGTVELSYLAERPPRAEGPFTTEERKLLDAVAERLGHVVERFQAEEVLREKEAELRARMTHLTRVSTMGELASSIAHEVNQPLTAIATYAQACRRLVDGGAVKDEEVTEILDRIADEALRAGNIIHRLRALVRRRPSELSRCDIVRLVEEISPLAFADARLHDVSLEFSLPSRLPHVLADGVQIQQVLLNLIRNGIDAMEEIPVHDRNLQVRVSRMNRQEVRVSVSDYGCGLPEEIDTALFEPFFTTKEGGLGLGLSISRSIIEVHGGRLWFSRNPGAGSTFLFTLPFVAEANSE